MKKVIMRLFCCGYYFILQKSSNFFVCMWKRKSDRKQILPFETEKSCGSYEVISFKTEVFYWKKYLMISTKQKKLYRIVSFAKRLDFFLQQNLTIVFKCQSVRLLNRLLDFLPHVNNSVISISSRFLAWMPSGLQWDTKITKLLPSWKNLKIR